MDVRTRILDAALGLLAQGGAQELTQPRVCKAAGIRQSHLTYYFPTVTDLLQAVARHSLDALAREFGAQGKKRPASLAEGIAESTRDKRRVRVMLGLVAATDRDPTLKPRMREFVDEIRGRIAPLLGAGGLEVTPENVAFMHTVVVGAAVLQLARDNTEARNEALEVIQRAVQCVAASRS